MKTIITTLLAGLLITQVSCAKSSEGTGLDKNGIIANAVFTDLEGNEVTISDFEGKVVLIDVWETWCAPCIVSMPTLHELAEDYEDDFVVVALSPQIMDAPEQVEEFVAENDYHFTYVFGRQFAVDIEVQSLPYKIYIGPDGEYLTTVIGSHGPEQDYEKTREIIEANINL